MEKTSLVQQIKMAACKLKGSKLKRLHAIDPVLEGIRKEMSLSTKEEAMILVAILDRQCANSLSDLEDLSDYFECPALDVMEFVPTIKSLLAKRFICVDDINERDITKMAFNVCKEVFDAIIEGRKVKPLPSCAEIRFDQFDFCNAIDHLIVERKENKMSTQKVFAQTLRMEEEYAKMPLIAGLKSLVNDIGARVLFYEMCKDFANDYEGGTSDLNSSLQDIYDKILEGMTVKKQLLENGHPLMHAGLIELTDDSTLQLAENGIKLLFGSVASTFIQSNVCQNKYDFVHHVDELVHELSYNPSVSELSRLYNKLEVLESRNKQLTVVTHMRTILRDRRNRLVYYLICEAAADADSYQVGQLERIFDKRHELETKRALKNEQHPLQELGLAELTSGNMFDDATLKLTEKGKELFFEEDMDLFEEKVSDQGLIQCDQIADKRLFFDGTLEQQLATLKNSLEENNYAHLCERLKENKLPTGMAVLLYGLPGTGKTESVMQIARVTGRPIMHVDISATKTCWFGESEKLIKEVFERYRKLCQKCKVKPILLFNEADALFSKRKDPNSSSVAQTENAIQNIILEEMENLDGILIATTNLADHLDKAFERRFLFKIRFDKPTIGSKARIWKDKMPRLTEAEAMRLASNYPFSGGEIDNVARKAMMEEVINGTSPTLERLTALCNEERIGKEVSKKIGF